MKNTTVTALAASFLTVVIWSDTASAQAAAVPAAAPAPDYTLTANIGLFSQYIFRGLSQTDQRPALQGGFDYSHINGFYAGIWGSNISWISDFNPGVSSSLEADTYFGYKKSLNDDWTADVGYLRYNYPGNYHGVTKADTNELYAAISWKWLTLKYSRSLGDTFGVPGAHGTYYLDLTAAVPLSEQTALTLHGGKQQYAGAGGGVSNDNYSYNDWKIELAQALTKEWSAALGFTDTNAKKAFYTPASTGRDIGHSMAYAFVKKTF